VCYKPLPVEASVLLQVRRVVGAGVCCRGPSSSFPAGVVQKQVDDARALLKAVFPIPPLVPLIASGMRGRAGWCVY
jgi:hypothetical protein